jgi:hypothetical protein
MPPMPEDDNAVSSTNSEAEAKPKRSEKAATPKGCAAFMWVSGILALALFLVPTGYVVKYYVVDNGPETARASGLDLTTRSTGSNRAVTAKRAMIGDNGVGNVALLVRVLEQDPDPAWRLLAVDSLAAVLARPHVDYLYPMECLSAKAALSNAAVADADPSVRSAASDAIEKVAEHGAVIVR